MFFVMYNKASSLALDMIFSDVTSYGAYLHVFFFNTLKLHKSNIVAKAL